MTEPRFYMWGDVFNVWWVRDRQTGRLYGYGTTLECVALAARMNAARAYHLQRKKRKELQHAKRPPIRAAARAF